MPLPDDVLADIYKNYRYIRPHKGIGVSKYGSMIELLCRHVSKEQHLVEIGSSDGYLIDALVSLGYKNIEGIEPSREYVEAKNHSLIRNEFFGDGTSFEYPVDVFFLMHVLEHFRSPRHIVAAMQRHLTPNGKIIFEVPNFDGFHHQHLLFFNRVFVSRFAKKIGLLLIEMEDTDAVLRVILQNNENTKEMENVHRTSEMREEMEGLLALAKNMEHHHAQIRRELEEFLRSTSERKIYWWGTGSTSIIALSSIDSNILQSVRLTLIDGDLERKGLSVPVSGLEMLSIRHPSDVIGDMTKNDALVIASAFSAEILGSIEGHCELPERVFTVSL